MTTDENNAAPDPQPAELAFDVEAMLAACVPGGNIVDPQVVADNIRAWAAERKPAELAEQQGQVIVHALADAYAAGAEGLQFGGLARMEAPAAALAATGKQQVGEVQGDARVTVRVEGVGQCTLTVTDGGIDIPASTIAALAAHQPGAPTFQADVSEWMSQCFVPSLYSNMTERGDRLLEEVLELLQANGYDQGRVATLVNYVFSRPISEPAQEVGGVMVTLAGYCWVAGLDMHAAGDAELQRITQPEVMAKIRRKQEAKNALHFDTPVPGNAAPPAQGIDVGQQQDAARWRWVREQHGVTVSVEEADDDGDMTFVSGHTPEELDAAIDGQRDEGTGVGA